MSTPAGFASYDFSGRVAVVTGAATGIGRAICDAFAQNGAAAVNWDRVPGDLGTPHAPRHFAVDITRPESIEAAVAATLDAYGRIDYLVNNAGFAGPTMPLDEYESRAARALALFGLVLVQHRRDFRPVRRTGHLLIAAR